ncbi:D-amino acid dehydrogenase [Undibacterium sp. TS12]|uniref:D-amino acid dehydrogenase n=1 Tax=Undibacterium sp. TS12 TaxID=2908202 RepID=UPI001F4C8549|nr:D-amino acid dehydrogenase [Undibacterium sp. TS12]MCH8621221.1 D-amino acid dehydrogenase [Undibacterium sp. TS12]
MKICIVGAGVIGLTSAYALAVRGHEVIVVDAATGPGQGASFGNGAQLSYSYVAPLADASVWKNLPAYLLDPRSPLSWRPRFDAAQWQWICAFLLACRPARSRQSTAELLQLAFYSRDCLSDWQGRLRLEFDYHTAGKLVMYSSDAAFKAAGRQVHYQEQLGCEQQILSVGQCLDVEPSLSASAHRWLGGVYTPSEAVGDCARFCTQLHEAIRRDLPGVTFCYGTHVTGMTREKGRLTALQAISGDDKNDIHADVFVFANGAGSATLAALAGIRLPVYPLKGYSITLDAPSATAGIPRVSITDSARKIVYARIGERLRVAGRVDIVGNDLQIDARRTHSLLKEAQALFPALAGDRDDIHPWAGMRPATPGGVPIIGCSPVTNLYLNTGHGALGWTLACGSAELLALQITGQDSPIASQAYRYQHLLK